jgi:phospholipase C
MATRPGVLAQDSGMANLQKIEHIVVLMLENRLSDHMLGYRDSPESQICHA